MCAIWVIFACLLHLSLQKSTPQTDHYIAAVVEYQVQRNIDNLPNYLQLISEASEQDADIIVFPELTLNPRNGSVNVPMYGILKEYPIPADKPNLYDETLVSLSEAARQYQIYVVVNFEEIVDCIVDAPGEYCPEKKIYLFNTNVVFDRNGAVVDRYRKINLFGEFSRTPALKPDLGIFTTDFGVTFGHFICFDLMFQVPAIQVVEKYNLTDIIFTTMWYSELPYLTAVQIQEAYAYAMDLNFLASGANNVRVGSAGSGIFSGKAGAVISIMPGLPTTRLLVAKVPKVPGKVTEDYPGPIYDNPSDLDNLRLKIDLSLPSHITRPIVQGFQEFTLVDKEVSCRFRIKMNNRNGLTRYQYRAAVLTGVRNYDNVATGGIRVCAVFSCTGEYIDTCGQRFTKFEENTTAIFEELSIIATVPSPAIVPSLSAKDSVFFPVSLTTSIMPLETKDYEYKVDEKDDVTDLSLTLKNHDNELYNFAVWGRVFKRDGEVPTPALSGASHKIVYSEILIGVIFFLLKLT